MVVRRYSNRYPKGLTPRMNEASWDSITPEAGAPEISGSAAWQVMPMLIGLVLVE